MAAARDAMLQTGRWRLLIATLPLVGVLATGPGLPPSRSAGAVPLGGRPMGSGSCSATACHGSIRPVGGSPVRRDEHTVWIARDPHARAFAVLHDERSERMVRNLAAGKSSYLPAYQDARCLACHTTPRTPADLAATAWQNEDGVGCEACHGPASGWIGPHTVLGWSRQFTPEQKEAGFGLTATKNLARRAEVCAGCHVGRRHDPSGVIDRDMNHDLIAAGHPRLNFEFSAYLANMPPHWVEKGQNAAADFPARAWVVGQVATAKAAAELLHGRAADSSAPWPEFSEYDCYACHHSLADQAWRQTPTPSKPRLGRPEWASWFAPMTLELATDGTLGDASVAAAYDRARQAVGGTWDADDKGRNEAARRAEELAQALDGWLRRLEPATLDAATVDRLLRTLRSADAWAKAHNWDAAAQRYLALVPLRQALVKLDPARDDPKLREELEKLLERLRFPPGEDGPGRQFSPTAILDN
jgi:hypothetical protein